MPDIPQVVRQRNAAGLAIGGVFVSEPERRLLDLAKPGPRYRRCRVRYLNGEIVLLGRLHSIATPVNEALRRACARLAYEGKPPRSLRSAEILREVVA